MGTFEKLGILVIVVIIVMILAVAIYQWGGAGNPTPATVVETPSGGLTIKNLVDLTRESDAAPDAGSAAPAPAAETWAGGVPKLYRISRDDKVWVLVVKRWGLKESFIQAIEASNPKIDFKKLKPGTSLVIPDPSAHRRTTGEKPAPQKSATGRLYEVKGGDTLETIAYHHLGAKTRWPDIVSMNPGLEPKRLFEGQEIYLPTK
jgi:nucleoid-associated protein YgaU